MCQKELALEIATSLARIFNYSFNSGVIQWYCHISKCVFKKRGKSNRIVVLTLMLYKVLENVSKEGAVKIMEVEVNREWDKILGGFSKSRSCHTNLNFLL